MTRVALLDVNVLVALFDPDHVHHEAVHGWFAVNREGGWATCPLTENRLICILSNPAYSAAPEMPAAIVRRVEAFCASGGHVLWADEAQSPPRGHTHVGERRLVSSAPVEVRRSHDQNPADPFAEIWAEILDVSGDEMRRFRRDGGFEDGMVFIRQ